MQSHNSYTLRSVSCYSLNDNFLAKKGLPLPSSTLTWLGLVIARFLILSADVTFSSSKALTHARRTHIRVAAVAIPSPAKGGEQPL